MGEQSRSRLNQYQRPAALTHYLASIWLGALLGMDMCHHADRASERVWSPPRGGKVRNARPAGKPNMLGTKTVYGLAI